MNFRRILSPIACGLFLFSTSAAQTADSSALLHQYERSTPFKNVTENYDVVVAGAGTGGIAAALQASRLGACVLLVENTDWIGGQMTAAGVTSMDEGYPSRAWVRERGVYNEFTMRVRAYYRARGKSVDTMAVSEDHFAVEPHVAQRVFYDMIEDTREGITPISKPAVLDLVLRSEISRVDRDGKKITSVTITSHANAGKDKKINCRVLIDATEDGSIIPKAGVAYRIGSWRSDQPRDLKSPPPLQPITWTVAIRQYPNAPPKEVSVPRPPPLQNIQADPARF